MTAGKASLFAKHRLASRLARSETTNVVVGAFSQAKRQADAGEATHPFAQTSSALSSEECALWEAAIQLGVVTVSMAEAQIVQGRTVATWMVEQKRDAEGEPKTRPRKSVDRALLLTLAVFNLTVLFVLATAIAWVFGLLG